MMSDRQNRTIGLRSHRRIGADRCDDLSSAARITYDVDRNSRCDRCCTGITKCVNDCTCLLIFKYTNNLCAFPCRFTLQISLAVCMLVLVLWFRTHDSVIMIPYLCTNTVRSGPTVYFPGKLFYWLHDELEILRALNACCYERKCRFCSSVLSKHSPSRTGPRSHLAWASPRSIKAFLPA